MKWPDTLILIRHDTSAYNNLKVKKTGDPIYEEFIKEYEKDSTSEIAKKLAVVIKEKFSLGTGDADTPLADEEGQKAYETGLNLRKEGTPIPDVIFVSPYKRTRLTFEHLKRGWPELANVKVYEDERVREQEHGLSVIYSDYRVFNILHPEQKKLYDLEGPYWYRFPQGENIPDVRTRNRSWMTSLTRDFAEKKVMVITHHLNILALRANLERMGADEFMDLDNNDKPINCGVTLYKGYPELGKEGHIKLEFYNKCYFNNK
jgi:broad specificity phosphatase PhoE